MDRSMLLHRPLRRICVAALLGVALTATAAQAQGASCPLSGVLSGATLTGGGTCVVIGPTDIAASGSLLNSATLLNAGGLGVEGVLVNVASIQNLNTLAVEDGGSLNNIGKINNHDVLATQGGGVVANWGLVTNFANVQNAGELINSGNILNSAGRITNSSSGSIRNDVGSLFTNQAQLETFGTFQNIGGRLLNSDIIINVGKMTNLVQGSVMNLGTVTSFGTIENGPTGSFKNLAGTLKNFGTLENKALAEFSNQAGSTIHNMPGAKITNSGEFSNEANLESLGKLVNRRGGVLTNGLIAHLTNSKELRNEAGARFENRGRLTNTGTLRNAGTFDIAITGQVDGRGEFVQTDGSTMLHTGAVLTQRSVKINGGTLAGSGTVTADAPVIVAAGAKLAPGDDGARSIGTLTFHAPVDLFGVLAVDVTRYAADRLVVSDVFTFEAGSQILFDFDASSGLLAGSRFDVLDAASFAGIDQLQYACNGLIDLFCDLSVLADSGGAGSSLWLSLRDSAESGGSGSAGGGTQVGVQVPEPAAPGLLLLGLLVLVMPWRWGARRQRRTSV